MFITSAPSRLPAGRGLEEHVDEGAAAQRGGLFLDLAVEGDEFLGEVEEAHDVRMGKSFDTQQMAAAEDERGLVSDVH
jgi:hypothetical protein